MSFPERLLQRRKPTPLPGHNVEGSIMKPNDCGTISNTGKGHTFSWTMGPVRKLAPDSSLSPRNARENYTKYTGDGRTGFKTQGTYKPEAFVRREDTKGIQAVWLF